MERYEKDTMAEDLSAAFDAVEAETEEVDDDDVDDEEEGGSEEDTEESVGDPSEEDEDGDEEEEDGDDDTEGEESDEDAGKPEAKGKGKPKGKSSEDGAREDADGSKGKEKEEKSGAAKETGLKAPVSWKAKAREFWGKMPKEAQEEVLRREQETERVLQTSTQARQFQQEFAQMVNPYIPYINREGVNPVQAAKNLFQAISVLHSGSARQKADVVATMFHRYNVSIEELAAAIDAGVGKSDARTQQQIQDAIAPYERERQEQQRQADDRRKQYRAQVAQQVETFKNSGKAEFFEDLREQIADLISAASNRGQQLSIEDAYEQAVRMDKDISEILDSRKRAEEKRKKAIAFKKKKRAASSVKGTSSTPVKKKGKPKSDREDMRGDIEAAFAKQEA